VPLVRRRPDGRAHTPGLATVELHEGDVIRLERTDRGEKARSPAVTPVVGGDRGSGARAPAPRVGRKESDDDDAGSQANIACRAAIPRAPGAASRWSWTASTAAPDRDPPR